MVKSRKQIVEEKIAEYSKVYDVIAPNDRENVKNLVELEMERERLSNALRKISPSLKPREVKAIHESLKDVNESYLNLTKELDISRGKRNSQDEDTSPMKDTEKNKKAAETMLDKRMKVLTCNKCGQPLAKYLVMVELDGTAEPGSINATKKPPKPFPFTIRCGCWKCASVHPVQDAEGKWHQVEPAEVIAEISNETHPII